MEGLQQKRKHRWYNPNPFKPLVSDGGCGAIKSSPPGYCMQPIVNSLSRVVIPITNPPSPFICRYMNQQPGSQVFAQRRQNVYQVVIPVFVELLAPPLETKT
jgi:hypothetical protein